MNDSIKESLITRQQNKIFLQLNLLNLSFDQKTHLHCHGCDVYYSVHEYYRFIRYAKKDSSKDDNFYSYSYGNRSGAVFAPIDNRCSLCKYFVQPVFRKYLMRYFHTSDFPSRNKPWGKYCETSEKNLYYDSTNKIYLTSLENETIDEPQRDISFYYLLKYLNLSLPKDIYTLIIDDEPFDDYPEYYWYTFTYDIHKAIRIYILNEQGNPVHNFVI